MFSDRSQRRSRTVAITAAVLIGFAVPVGGVGSSCPADVDWDGVVGITDLLSVLEEWGQGSGTSDFTGIDHISDGIVDIHDFLGVLTEWGPCPKP